MEQPVTETEVTAVADIDEEPLANGTGRDARVRGAKGTDDNGEASDRATSLRESCKSQWQNYLLVSET